jgi:hypothetical protein
MGDRAIRAAWDLGIGLWGLVETGREGERERGRWGDRERVIWGYLGWGDRVMGVLGTWG